MRKMSQILANLHHAVQTVNAVKLMDSQFVPACQISLEVLPDVDQNVQSVPNAP